MTTPPALDRVIDELGRTEGSPDTLAHLVRDQETRRLLLVRAVLDAVEESDPTTLPAGARERFRDHWALLEEAEGVDASGEVRARLLHPLTGAWASGLLRRLSRRPSGDRPADEEAGATEPGRALAHFGAMAAAAAARAGLAFRTRVTAVGEVLVLPGLGALHTGTAERGAREVEVVHRRGTVTVSRTDLGDVTVRLQTGYGAWSASPAWRPAYALPALAPGVSVPGAAVPGAGGAPGATVVPLDDLDPYRTARGGPRAEGLSGPCVLGDLERKRWLQSWSAAEAALRLGGEHRVGEAVALLRCVVPLQAPPGVGPDGTGGSCTGTRREAFGALLSSTPPTPATLAATVVHELHHAKLSALSDMTDLHRADGRARYFAPWRPDPRPFDGLLQGTYSHLALADHFQRCALTLGRPADRETAWELHARYHAQVAAALPALVGSPDLTPEGRRFVDGLVATHRRLTEHPPPRGHAARAAAYVEAARSLWRSRHTTGNRPFAPRCSVE